jgi:hypothetical protein
MITINDKIDNAKLPPQTQILPKITDIPNPWTIAGPQQVQQSAKEKARQEATFASKTQQLTELLSEYFYLPCNS